MSLSRILIVEDDITFSSVLKLALKGKGYEVEVAINGIEALEKADKFHPDIIILDVNLPILSGFDVAMRLREKNEFKDTPIIMLTALTQEANIKRGYSVGVDDYLTKPFNIEHLFLKIEKYLR